MYRLAVFVLCLAPLLIACKETVRKPTLADVDVSSRNSNTVDIYIKPQSEEQVRQAYAAYLRNASKHDRSRMTAITRLAELELEMTEKLLKEQENLATGDKQHIDDSLYDARLDKTVELLETSLRDYPEAKNNDRLLYQLAKVYAQKGEHEQSMQALQQLALGYHKSPYYVEAQFRLAENYFSRRDYLGAEDAYTEVIISPNNSIFYEKSLFKRGWSRFKQELYTEAVDDFLRAVADHGFDDLAKMDTSEKDQFDEYFRAIGLAFSYLGGAEQLHAYFSNDADFKYVYYTYSTVSNIYLQQERFSDAVSTLEQFIKYYPNSSDIPYAQLGIIDIWKNSGFENRIYAAIENFYQSYNPASAYWKNDANTAIAGEIEKSLKKYLLLVAGHYHNRYQENNKQANFSSAERWYKRYLKHYQSHARQDNIFFLYAELLSQHQQLAQALQFYEQAAYDNDIILNKDAAYATITVTDRLYTEQSQKDRNSWLDKHIRYALLFSQLYPLDSRSATIILHAAELAYSAGQFKKSIELTNLIADTSGADIIYQANIIKAQAYFSAQQYTEAEAIYLSLSEDKLAGTKAADYRDRLALAIYKQAEVEKQKGDVAAANQHFSRISDVVPESSIAATALYDAIALCISEKMWQQSIQFIGKFQARYPADKRSNDVSKKLSVAYLNSGQDIKAAREFEKISSLEQDAEVKMAALWQAAELYEEKKDYESAIRSYARYAREYKKPFSQYMEAMHKLTVLYTASGNATEVDSWRRQIIKADKTTGKKQKTDRTRYLASLASLELARSSHQQFSKVRLVKPLKANLHKKKNAMQAAVKLYGQASVYGIMETATEATYAIASIYGDFSRALLDSERPDNLGEEELIQYEILLEDQAFPFEEKAIEFYETNLSRVKDGIYNDWIRQSHGRLKKLFPVRYQREPKTDTFVNVFH
jgi:tetratricopeptide (TPR) repeat protein